MDLKQNNLRPNVKGYKSSSAKASDSVHRMAVTPDGPALCSTTRKSLRPYSSPCRMYSRSCYNTSRPSSSTTEIANPVLSFLDIKRILFEKITDRGDELKRAFQLLDTGQNMTVSKSELKRIITVFLLPLTREQFRDILAQIPLTSSGTVSYSDFLNRFGGIDLNIHVFKRASETENEKNCCRTVKELETQVGGKMGLVLYTAALTLLPLISFTICSSIHILPNSSLTNDKKLGDIPLLFKNIKMVTKAFKLIDVNKTGLIQEGDLRRILDIFCMKMKDEEYKKFAKHYNIDKDAAVNYNAFMKDLSTNTALNLRYYLENQEDSLGNQQTKYSKKEYLPSSVSSEDIWKNYSLDEIKNIFCQEFSKSYEHVEKALSAGDPTKGGFISLNYLKIVLDTFVYRLPRRVFIQLMRRFGLRTTSRINWKHFLTLLKESQWLEVNNAFPLAKRNSINSRNQSYKGNIITKLFSHGDHYASLKKALLIANDKPDGCLTTEELRHILNCMVIKISDSEFEELLRTLDPSGTGMISVSTFVGLLEQDPKMRKMSYPDTKEPPPMAWDSVEEIIHDTIARNRHALREMLQSYDPGATGLISRNNFKKAMLIYCPFLTAEHLIKLYSKFQDVASGRILYKKLLAYIGINNLSSSPAPIRKDPLEKRQMPDLSERTRPASHKSTLTRSMTMDEVLGKLKTYIQKQDPVFRRRFLDYSKEPCSKIGKHDFRKVLEDNGMPMNNDQYALLTAKIGYKAEGMSYLDLATRFADNKISGPEVTSFHAPPPSKTNLDSFFITAEECLKLFPRRLKEYFRDPYSAFFKIDTDRDGIINMHDLNRLLRQLLINLKDEEFERFLHLLGLRLSMTLNFREFQGLFEKTPFRADDAPQRLIRPKQKVADSDLACEQAHQYLATKARNRWSDLSKNFLETDNEGNGILRRRDIKNALYGFDIPLTPREFEKLWTRYDTEGRGYITYQEFLQKLGISYSAELHRPYMEDYFNFMGHFTKPQQLQEEMKELQQHTDKAVLIRDKLKEHYQDISKALTKQDKSKGSYISVCKILKVLQECGCPLKEEELTNLLKSWGIGCHNNTVNYLDFLRMLENKPAKPQTAEKEESVPVDFSMLNPDDMLKNVREVVATSSLALATACFALDKEDTGFLKASDFGQVLKDFCYKLSDNQYHYFLRKLRLHLTPYINWKYFLQNFNSFLEENAAEWAEKMPKGPPPPSSKEVAFHEILARLHKAVTAHYHAIAQELENFDTMKTNTVSRDEFRAICTRHVQVLTDEQFDRLWNEMPVNAKGQLKCQDFLSSFSSEKVGTPQASMDSTHVQRGSSIREASSQRRSAMSSRDLKARPSHPCTPSTATSLGIQPLQNCEPIESKLRKKIQGCWRELLKDCKERDTDKQGEITAADFLALVEKFSLDISKEECQQLLVKYDLRNNGKFCYCDFIQSCVLLLKSKETSLMQRMKIQNANKMTETGPETCSFYSALLRIQPQIVHCWRPMRRTFKSYDEAGSGFLSVGDFRKVLRQYSINLSEEEFFHILEYYDKTLSSRISYNDFLRAFLQ